MHSKNKLLMCLLPIIVLILLGGILVLYNVFGAADDVSPDSPDSASADYLTETGISSEDLAFAEAVSPQASSSQENTAVHSDEPASDSRVQSEEPPESQNVPDTDTAPAPNKIGAFLNEAAAAMRRTFSEGFYAEPLSEELIAYMTGRSLPADYPEIADSLAITADDLAFLHVLHYTAEGNISDGEIIVNQKLADDFLDIFSKLYENKYPIESIVLVDVFDGDDLKSMEANNTSCFNYRTVEGSASLSQHSYGRAIDINPFYNPYITYSADGSEKVSPAEAAIYADRSLDFPYKIDKDDLCYKLFKEKGYTWGGSWQSLKDYQHFQKKD